MIWNLADATDRFDEVFTRAIEDGPQVVTDGDREVVVLSKATYRLLAGEQQDLLAFLMNGPSLEEVRLARDKRPLRHIDLQAAGSMSAQEMPALPVRPRQPEES